MAFVLVAHMYLSSAESNHQVRDKGVFSLSRAMADHDAPTTVLCQFTPMRHIARPERRNEKQSQWMLKETKGTNNNGLEVAYAWMDSVTEPIWLTLSSRQLQAFLSTACWMRLGLVTVRSSPTI